MKINKIILTEKDVLIFLRSNIIEQLSGSDEKYYDDAYLLSLACDALTELLKDYEV